MLPSLSSKKQSSGATAGGGQTAAKKKATQSGGSTKLKSGGAASSPTTRGATSSLKDAKKKLLPDSVKVQDWSLPASTAGTYRSCTYAIRETIRMKMEAVRTNEQKRNEFDDYCFTVNKERQGERSKSQQILLENAKERIRSFSPDVRHGKANEQGRRTDTRIEEARRKKIDSEMEWYTTLHDKCEAHEERHNTYVGSLRQVELLRVTTLAASIAAFGAKLHQIRLEQKKAAKSAFKKKGSKRGGADSTTLGTAISAAFDISFVDEDATGEAERGMYSLGTALLVWKATGIFAALAYRVRRRLNVKMVKHYLLQVQKSSQVVRALQSFFYRVRNAQRISKALVRVIRMREKLVEMYWEKEERKQIQELLHAYGIGNKAPKDRSMSVSTRALGGRSPSVFALNAPGRSPSIAGGLLPPLQQQRRSSSIAADLQQDDSLADPSVWRPRQQFAPLPATGVNGQGVGGSMAKKRQSLAPGGGNSPLDAPMMSAEHLQQLHEIGATMKEAFSHGIPIAIKNSRLQEYIAHMRRVNLATMHEYSIQRNKFLAEKERLQMLLRRGLTMDPITGKSPEDELLLLTKPQHPLIMCLPQRPVVEAHVALCLSDVLKRHPTVPSTTHQQIVTPERKRVAERFDADVKFQIDKKDKRTKNLLRKKKKREQQEHEEEAHGFEFSFGLPNR